MTANGELMFLQLNQGFMYCVNNQDTWESNIYLEKGKNSCKYGEKIFLSCHGKGILPGNTASMASSWGHQMSPHQSTTSLMCLPSFDSSSCSISSPLHFYLIPTLAASMENSEQVLSESCNSYRWLMCIKSSLDSLGDSNRSFDTQDGSSFIEVDPECISLRWAIDANGFGFDLPRSQSSDHILFSKGLLQLPVLDKSESLSSSRSLLSLPNHCRSISSSLISSTLFQSAHDTPSSRSLASRNAKLRHCAGCLKKVIWRYMCFLMHLCEKVKALRLTSSRSEKSCTNLAGSSRRTSDSCSSIECCNSYADISIHDAILHCKKSNEQDK